MEHFVTGETGFVGTTPVKQLVDEGNDVLTGARSRSNASRPPDKVGVVEVDITDKASLREPMVDLDGVFHMVT